MRREKPKAAFEVVLLIVFLVAYLFLWIYNTNAHVGIPVVLSVTFYLIVGICVMLTAVVVSEIYGIYTGNKDAAYEFIGVIRLIGYPILLIALLGAAGINITSLLVGAGFLGIVVGLAAQTTLGNLFSGFALLYTKPFRVGDKIAVSTPQYSAQSPSHPHGMLEVEISGFVKSIGMMHTRILRDDMTMVYIPNSIMNLGLITNYSKAPERLVVLRADLGRRIDTKALKVRLAKEFKSKEFAAIKDFTVNTATITTDSDVGIIVTARVPQLDYHRLREAMADRLNEVLRKRNQ